MTDITEKTGTTVATTDEAAIQIEFENRICSRKVESVVEYFAQTDVMPSAANIARMMEISDKIQEVYDIRGGEKPPPETRFFNMYLVFSGSSDITPHDLVHQYFCPC